MLGEQVGGAVLGDQLAVVVLAQGEKSVSVAVPLLVA
jgi:hypothetical protein